MPFWVTLKDKPGFCMMVDPNEWAGMMKKYQTHDREKHLTTFDWDGYSQERDRKLFQWARKYGDVINVESLPYAANPQKPYKEGYDGFQPSFCFTPLECKGKNSCQRPICCCD